MYYTIGLVIPELYGKMISKAQCVPVRDDLLTGLVLVLNKSVTVQKINDDFKKVTQDNDTLSYDDTGLASSDMIGNTHDAIFDPTMTKVLDMDDSSCLVKGMTTSLALLAT
jgi:glyceraldehyde 3-phosphate dehydrogenase